MRLTPALFVLAFSVAPARAAVSDAAVQARLGGLLGAWQLQMPDVPALVPAVLGRAVGTQQAPLIPKSYWDKSLPPHASHLTWLKGRIPGLDAASLREISYEDVAAVLDAAAALKYSTLDVFTDAGLRGDVAYYLQASTVKKLFASHELNTALVAGGKDVDGNAYTMDGIVMGRGKLHILFNRGPFTFDHPSDGRTYEVQSRIVQTIEGPGRLAVSGMKTKHWPVWPVIQRLIKLGPGRIRIETNYGSKDQDDRAVRRR